MDSLIDTALPYLVKASIKVGFSVVRDATVGVAVLTLPDSGPTWRNREELEANVRSILGDKLCKQLLLLKQFVHKTVQVAASSIKSCATEQAILGELNDIFCKTQTMYEAFCYFIECPDVEFRKTEFQQACEKHEPQTIIAYLHQQIKPGVCGESLLDRILLISQPRNVEKFDLWRKRIECILLMVYLLRTFDLKMKLQCGFGSNDIRKSLHHTVELELDSINMKKCAIMEEFAKATTSFKYYFVFNTCGDATHQKCGSSGDNDCCLLGAYVYQFLRENRKVSTGTAPSLTSKLVSSLRDKWPYVHWSVVLSGGVKVHSLDSGKVWFHSQGSAGGSAVFLDKRVHTKPLPQVPNFTLGCLHRYRRRVGTKYSEAVVFWTVPSEIEAVQAERASLTKRLFTPKYAGYKHDDYRRLRVERLNMELNGSKCGVAPVIGLSFRNTELASSVYDFQWEDDVVKAHKGQSEIFPVQVHSWHAFLDNFHTDKGKGFYSLTVIWPAQNPNLLAEEDDTPSEEDALFVTNDFMSRPLITLPDSHSESLPQKKPHGMGMVCHPQITDQMSYEKEGSFHVKGSFDHSHRGTPHSPQGSHAPSDAEAPHQKKRSHGMLRQILDVLVHGDYAPAASGGDFNLAGGGPRDVLDENAGCGLSFLDDTAMMDIEI